MISISKVPYKRIRIFLNPQLFWTKLCKISWFVSGEHINWLRQKNLSARHWQITIFCDNRYRFNNCFIIRWPSLFLFFNYSPKNLPFSRKSDGKKEKSVDSFTHEQNIICSQTQLDDIAHEQTINYFWAVICRSRGGLSSNEKEEKFASNDNLFYPVTWWSNEPKNWNIFFCRFTFIKH